MSFLVLRSFERARLPAAPIIAKSQISFRETSSRRRTDWRYGLKPYPFKAARIKSKPRESKCVNLLRLRRRCRLCSRFVRRHRMFRTRACDRNLINLHWIIWLVIRATRHARDLLHQFHALVIALAKNRVMTIQTLIGNFGDKKLRAICIRASIGIREPPWTVESEIRRSFILELISRIAFAVSERISALNHEFRNHAVKYSAVVKRRASHFAAGCRVGPLFCSLRQPDKICDAYGSFVREQLAGDFPGGCVNDCGG